MHDTLSIVIPVHNENENITATIQEIICELNKIEVIYKIIIIDDGSSDESWTTIKEIVNQYTSIKAIKFSKNFGKDKAILAGLESENSDYYLVIDADGEHPINKISEFYKKAITTNSKVVHGIKRKRRGTFAYIYLSKIYNKTFKRFTKIDLFESSDYKLFSKKARDAIISYGDNDYFFRAIASDVGFDTEHIEFDEKNRIKGKSSWNFTNLFKYAINSIISFSHIPLYTILVLGSLTLFLGFLLIIKIIYILLIHNSIPDGYLTLLLISLISMGTIMISLGIIGLYLSKIFDIVKQRPRYLIEEVCNDK